MKTFWLMLALLLTGCKGVAISLTYTPPMTVGLTFDARSLYPTPEAPATAATKPAETRP